jgi:hypothetical protein
MNKQLTVKQMSDARDKLNAEVKVLLERKVRAFQVETGLRIASVRVGIHDSYSSEGDFTIVDTVWIEAKL